MNGSWRNWKFLPSPSEKNLPLIIQGNYKSNALLTAQDPDFKEQFFKANCTLTKDGKFYNCPLKFCGSVSYQKNHVKFQLWE